MAISFIGSTEITELVRNVVATPHSSTQQNDILFAFSLTQDYRLSTPSGWTSLGYFYDSLNSGHYWELFYKIASSSDYTTSYTWTTTGSQKTRFSLITLRSGFDYTDAIDIVSNTSYVTSNSIVRAASMNVSSTNSPLLFFGAFDRDSTNTVTFTKPSVPTTDWTEYIDTGSTTIRYWNTFCMMTWSSSGATGNIDGTIDGGVSGARKHAFAVALNPSLPSGPANLKSYNTNLKANIKTINGNPIANVKSLNTNV